MAWSSDFLIALCMIGVFANFASPTRLKSIFGGFRNVADTPPASGISDNRGPILMRRRPSNSIWFSSAGAFKTVTWALNSYLLAFKSRSKNIIVYGPASKPKPDIQLASMSIMISFSDDLVDIFWLCTLMPLVRIAIYPLLKWDASSRWLFGPNSAWGSLATGRRSSL